MFRSDFRGVCGVGVGGGLGGGTTGRSVGVMVGSDSKNDISFG